MLRFALLIARKDLRIVLPGGGSLVRGLLLGLLLIFVFSLSRETGRIASGREAATIFWLASTFCQILIFNQLYSLEEINDTRLALLFSPYPVQGIWLGKAIAGLLLLILAQIFLLPATIVFLGADIASPTAAVLASLGLADPGICVLGSLLGAMSSGASGREALFSIIFFPLLIPLLLAAISLMSQGNEAGNPAISSWVGIAAAFDAIFLACGLALFPYLYQGDD